MGRSSWTVILVIVLLFTGATIAMMQRIRSLEKTVAQLALDANSMTPLAGTDELSRRLNEVPSGLNPMDPNAGGEGDIQVSDLPQIHQDLINMACLGMTRGSTQGLSAADRELLNMLENQYCGRFLY